MTVPSVAICFSGLPRLSAQKAINSWLKIVKQYKANVFVHTWLENENDRDWIEDRIIPIFKPKMFKYEPFRNFDVSSFTERHWPTVNPYRMMSGFTSVNESIALATSFKKYDFIVRARFDVEIDELLLSNTEGVTVHDDKDKHILKFNYRNREYFGINDLVAYGSDEMMRLYARTNQNMYDLYHYECVDVCPEIFLTSNLIKEGVDINFQNIPHRIVRG